MNRYYTRGKTLYTTVPGHGKDIEKLVMNFSTEKEAQEACDRKNAEDQNLRDEAKKGTDYAKRNREQTKERSRNKRRWNQNGIYKDGKDDDES